MSPERTILYRRDGRIAWMTLNRPEVLNAEDMTFLSDLTQAVHALRDDREARVAVVTGAGRAFCSGVDLTALSSGGLGPAFFTDIEYLWDILENCDKAVICGIHGYCLGGGLQIALACDLRIASEDAILGLPAVKECLIPGLGTYRLPRLIGMGRARELLLLGDTIDARRALEIGLVNAVVPRGELEAQCLVLAERLLAVPHTSMSHIKRLSNLAFQTDFAGFMHAFVPAMRACLASQEHQAAMAAFRAEQTAKARGSSRPS
ncbi:MAG: enoyl-CoA hydratase/isomerase family protein [candidate division NC10 bacterium]|nr:enoyl-CoA hydratase/isomerase family protein [candidate division NC10 bacterium]